MDVSLLEKAPCREENELGDAEIGLLEETALIASNGGTFNAAAGEKLASVDELSVVVNG